jgi:hypothetical protein
VGKGRSTSWGLSASKPRLGLPRTISLSSRFAFHEDGADLGMHGNKHLPVCSGPRIALWNGLLGQDPNNLSLIRFPKERYADMAMSPSKYDLSEKWSGILRQYCSLDIALERDITTSVIRNRQIDARSVLVF